MRAGLLPANAQHQELPPESGSTAALKGPTHGDAGNVLEVEALKATIARLPPMPPVPHDPGSEILRAVATKLLVMHAEHVEMMSMTAMVMGTLRVSRQTSQGTTWKTGDTGIETVGWGVEACVADSSVGWLHGWMENEWYSASSVLDVSDAIWSALICAGGCSWVQKFLWFVPKSIRAGEIFEVMS
jgi:hypothetical protein